MKAFILIFLLTVIAFAENIKVEYVPFTPWTKLSFEDGYLAFENVTECKNDLIEDNTLAYYSSLDSDYAVFVFLKTSTIKIWGLYPSFTASETSVTENDLHKYIYKTQLAEVLKYEFLNLQKKGVLGIAADSAERLIDKVIGIMGAENSSSINSVSYMHGKSCDSSQICMALPVDGGEEFPLKQFELLQKKYPTKLNIDFNHRHFNVFKLTNRSFFVGGKNCPYFVLDLNGKIVASGIVYNGIVNVSITHAILKIQNRTLYIK